MRFLLTTSLCVLIGFSGAVGLSDEAHAQLPVDNETPVTTRDQAPLSLKNLKKYRSDAKAKVEDLPFDIRAEALKEAALSFGARGGLAKRTYEIRSEMDTRTRYLDRVFNFGQLLIAAPSGFMIEPPVVSEALNAMLIEVDGQTAATTDKVFHIIRNARIVSAPRTWRQYLQREWGQVLPPPDVLTPQNAKEIAIWESHIKKGWKSGYSQADDIFREDLAKLESDFQGMIRYRLLLAQGMVSPPYALQVDRGVTGGGDEMRVGDRAVQITGVPELMSGADAWKPASR